MGLATNAESRKIRRKLIFVVLMAASLVTSASAWAPFNLGSLDVKSTLAMREYCHIIRFPRVWTIRRQDKNGQPLIFDYSSDYEFRVEGVLSTQFLVGGFTELVRRRYYTFNRYKVDLSNPSAAILPANAAAWEASAVIPLTRKSAFPPSGMVPSERKAEFNGLEFAKTGDIWSEPSDGASRLSPDGAWLVLQSRERENPGGTTKIFFDIFNAATGRKILTMEGTYTSSYSTADVDGNLHRTAWVTERYFIVPLGEHKERCLVCEFGSGAQQGSKK